MGQPRPASVTITATGIGGSSVAANYNNVKQLNFDFFNNKINVVDETGSFYFTLDPVATLTYTVTAGAARVVIAP